MISYDDIKCYFNPFTPALHIQIQVPGVACDVIILNNSVIYFGQEKEIFQTIPDWSRFHQGCRRKMAKCHYKVDPKILCSSFQLILRYQKHFPPKCSAKQTNKPKRSGKDQKCKEKVKTAVSLLHQKCISKCFWLSANAWTFGSWYFATGPEGCWLSTHLPLNPI